MDRAELEAALKQLPQDAVYRAKGLVPVTQVRFCRYRFCPTSELKYRGAVGLGYRSTYKRTLYIKFCC